MPKEKKGQVAGLNLLLGVIVMLFICGFLVMIFSLMGGEMEATTYNQDVAQTAVANETTGVMNESVGSSGWYALTNNALRDAQCVIGLVTNATGGETIASGNYTTSNCLISVSANVDAGYNNTAWNVSYTSTADTDSTASGTINKTYTALSGVTDWFDIIIVIGAMVVLILLTVIIISAIRGSGMMGA